MPVACSFAHVVDNYRLGGLTTRGCGELNRKVERQIATSVFIAGVELFDKNTDASNTHRRTGVFVVVLLLKRGAVL